MNVTQRTIEKLRKLWKREKATTPKRSPRDTRPRYNRRLQRGRNSSKIDRG